MSKGRTAHRLVAIAALSLAAGGAIAAMPSFAVLDQDGDGYITAAEARVSPALQEAFAAADGDGDGKLSKEEYETIEG